MVDNLLTICYDCGNIKLPKGEWLSKENDKARYDSLINQYKDNLINVYCPLCEGEMRKEARIFRSMNGN